MTRRRELVCVAVALVSGAVVLVSTTAAPHAAQSPDLSPLQEWAAAVVHHDPGLRDASVLSVAGWATTDFRELYAYLRALAQVLAGTPPNRAMRGFENEERLELQLLAQEFRRAFPVPGEGLKRAALLHTDLALLDEAGPTGLEPRSRLPYTRRSASVPYRSLAIVNDGRYDSTASATIHWDIARLLLDGLRPHDALDSMVLDWYRAVAAHFAAASLQGEAIEHLEQGRKAFPNDAVLLYESGVLHEVWASPRVQSAIESASITGRAPLKVESIDDSLDHAESFFRQALTNDPGFAPARVRLGRVLSLKGRFADARAALQDGVDSAQNRRVKYYGLLFLGHAQERLGQIVSARKTFEAAAALFPAAQSPYLALSQLARRVGDVRAASRHLQPVLALPADAARREDPWWNYFTKAERDDETLLSEIRAPFRQRGRQ